VAVQGVAAVAVQAVAAVAVQAVAAVAVQAVAAAVQPEVAEEAVAGLWAAAAVVGLRLAVRAEAAAVVGLQLAARPEAAAVVGLQLAARPDAGRLAWADDPVERQAAPLSDAAVAMEIGGPGGAISTAARS
jgi:hypothetical protein